MEEFIRSVGKAIAPIERRVMNMLARAVIATINDTPQMQTVQVALLADEIKDGVERMQNYGFTSVPHPDAEGIVLFLNGNRDHGIVLAVDDRRYRITGLQNGEVAIYTDEDQLEHGHRIILKRDQKIEVQGLEVEIKAGELIRLESKNIEVNATESYKRDVFGLGTHWTYNPATEQHHTATYGCGTSSSHTCVPPEIP